MAAFPRPAQAAFSRSSVTEWHGHDRRTRTGVYAMGTATAQSAYAPAFIAHAANKTIVVTE